MRRASVPDRPVRGEDPERNEKFRVSQKILAAILHDALGEGHGLVLDGTARASGDNPERFLPRGRLFRHDRSFWSHREPPPARSEACPPPVLQAAMKNDILDSLSRLSDTELVARMKSLVARERDATAGLVAHLAEMDTRDVYLREGYPSLFVYCRDLLGLSEAESGNRIVAARAARRFPVILELLASGQVNLTAVRLLAPHLTAGNHGDVLASARGKSKLEVEEIVARLAPRPDVPSSVRRLPAPRLDPGPFLAAALPAPARAALPAPAAEALPPLSLPVRPVEVRPLSPDRYKLQLTIGGETLEKLRLAKDMLGHAIPSGDEAAILDRALTALLVELAKKKFADTPRPRRARGRKAGARGDASAAVKRAVWVRDLGRCRFIGTSGHRCNERRFLEFHHVDPRALGGEASVDLIQLRCRRHNDYEGRLWFGKRRRDGSQLVREPVMSYASGRSTLREHVPEHGEWLPRVRSDDAYATSFEHFRPGGHGSLPEPPSKRRDTRRGHPLQPRCPTPSC